MTDLTHARTASREPDVLVVRATVAALAGSPLLSADEQRRALGLPAAAAAAFVAGRSLARRLLGRWLDRDPGTLAFDHEPDGKPRLDGGGAGGLDFSVAHGGPHVLVALARGRQVGVDVEPIAPGRAFAAITAAALGDQAAAALRRTPRDRRAARFTGWWVRLEAVAKATGAGLTFPVTTAIPAGFAVRAVAMPAGHRAAVAFDGPRPARLAIQDWSRS